MPVIRPGSADDLAGLLQLAPGDRAVPIQHGRHEDGYKRQGLQTNRPLKRGINPFGGIRMARAACQAYGYRLSDTIEDEFTYRTTHNDGVYLVYTSEMRKARKLSLIHIFRFLFVQSVHPFGSLPP